MEAVTTSLKRVPIFSSLGDSDLAQLAGIAVPKSYRKNRVLFRQGDPGNILFVLTKGTVKVSLIGSSGKEIILRMMFPDEFFGEMSLLDGKFRSATVTAVEDCEALLIDRTDFTRLIAQNPQFVLEIMATLNRRLRNATDRIASLTFFDAYGKVAQVLIELIDKYGKKEGTAIVLDTKCSRQEMAGMAGLTRETFTRVLHEFHVRGYLTVERKKILISDEALLRREII